MEGTTDFDGGDVEGHVDFSYSKNGFTWVQNSSGGNVEEHVELHTRTMASLVFKTFRGWAMLMNMASFKGYNCVHWGSQIAVTFTQNRSISPVFETLKNTLVGGSQGG